MRVLVTGGRGFDDRELLWWTLDDLHSEKGVSLIIHGAAPGVDTLTNEWAAKNRVPVIVCPAQWTKYAESAGPRCDRSMLNHKPDLVVAFSGGMANMVSAAREAGVQVMEVEDE